MRTTSIMGLLVRIRSKIRSRRQVNSPKNITPAKKTLVGASVSVTKRRGQPVVMSLTTTIAMLIASLPMSAPAFAQWRYESKINSIEYKRQYGSWEKIQIPEEFKLNTIHAAYLPTGKVLLVAGSGNDRKNFDEFNQNQSIKVLKTIVLDVETGKVKSVDTPTDLFCAGHTFLQSGKLLVAGGTSGYETLKENVKKVGGAMMIYNENPDSQQKTFPKGTEFLSEFGKVYYAAEEFILDPATKVDHGRGHVVITRSQAKVFVLAAEDGSSFMTSGSTKYELPGLSGDEATNIYGQSGAMTMEKQDYRGDENVFEFNPVTEQYEQVGDMHESRWYPSLPVLHNGHVLAVSGLDNTGNITQTTEEYNPSTKEWELGQDFAVPTYPALFRTNNPDVLFYSGSVSGWGPADKGRDPGFWNYKKNTFKKVEGLRAPELLETSASVQLPPKKGSNDGSQSTQIMVAGGGGIGESPLSTRRVDVIDIAAKPAMFQPGPDLPDALRYVNMVVTPWDEVFGTGGSRDYRARGNSYSYKAFSMDMSNKVVKPLADEPVGRNYHSGALLLKDGRILVFGGDPLYGDKNDSSPGKFEQTIEIFTPPQFFRGERPVLSTKTTLQAKRGDTLTFNTNDADRIQTARMIPPSSATHTTNLEQRSIGAVVKQQSGSTVSITIPNDPLLVTKGWYMLFGVDNDDISSRAIMVEITE